MESSTFLSRFLTFVLTIFFKLLYHSFAWVYDWVAWSVSLGRWNEWILSTQQDLLGQTILEVGHGTGHLQLALAKTGRFACGLDESRQMGSITRARLRRAGYIANLTRGIAQALPFQDGSFQYVVSTFPSNFIFDPLTLAEIYRVLVPGGKLVVIPVAWLTGKGWPDRLAATLFHITGQAPEWNERYLHPFNKAGFSSFAERRTLPSSQMIVIIAKKI